MAVSKSIPAAIKRQVKELVEAFNDEISISWSRYELRFKGPYVYLDRQDPPRFYSGPIARLEYGGSLTNWRFVIFRYSFDDYDPAEDGFPGFGELDGSIVTALRVGLKAYPPDWRP